MGTHDMSGWPKSESDDIECGNSNQWLLFHSSWFENPRLPRLSEKGGMNNVASSPWIHCSFCYPETGV